MSHQLDLADHLRDHRYLSDPDRYLLDHHPRDPELHCQLHLSCDLPFISVPEAPHHLSLPHLVDPEEALDRYAE